MLEKAFPAMNLCVLNNGSVTCIHPATGSTFALDLSLEAVLSVEDPLIKTAEESIPKTCFLKQAQKVPWFNEQCK